MMKSLTALFGAEHIQQMQDAYAALVGLSVFITDQYGNRLTNTSRPDALCPAFASSGEIPAEWAADAAELAGSGQPCRFERLERFDLAVACVPIYFDHAFLGCWYLGYILPQGASPDDLAAQYTRAYGVSPEAARRAVSALPVITEAAFEPIKAYLHTLDNIIGAIHRPREHPRGASGQPKARASAKNPYARTLRRFVDASDAAMFVFDYDRGDILLANERFGSLVGLPADKAVGAKGWIASKISRDSFYAYCPREKILDEQGLPLGPYSATFPINDGNAWAQFTFQALEWERGLTAVMVTIYDITEQIRIRNELKRIALYDSYTGLPNAKKLLLDVRRELAGKSGGDQPLICLFVRGMTKFTGFYGHYAGKVLFFTIAQWLLSQQIPHSTLYQNGNYFCLRLIRAGESEALRVARMIRGRFDASWSLSMGGSDISYYCPVTMAVISAYESAIDADIIDLIDRTMVMAGETDDIFIFDREMDEKAQKNMQFEMDLKNAVMDNMRGLDVHYQPIVEIQTGRWRGLEALCRWTGPNGPVPPSVFIPEAEKMGLIGMIGEFVLKTAIMHCKAFGLDAYESFYLSVNVSPTQMMDESFADCVLRLLETHQYPGEKLNLEVTESTEYTFNSFTCSVIEKLRGAGIKMALDDFGTGYSSFNNLKNLPISYVKTERAFVQGIEGDTYLQYFLYIMSELAHANNMQLIAEGVETREQMEIVRSNGADFIQGYYFSKPLTAQTLSERLSCFSRNDDSLTKRRADPVNIQQWLLGKDAYVVTPNLFLLLNQCMKILLTTGDSDTAFSQVLEIVGAFFSVDHVFLYELCKSGRVRRVHEWALPGVNAHAFMIAQGDMTPLIQTLKPLFEREGMLLSPDAQSAVDDPLAPYFPGGISYIILPLREKDTLIGMVGFDSNKPRSWSSEEIIMLSNLSIIIQNKIQQETLRQEVSQSQSVLQRTLNGVEMNVMVSDLNTNKILWVNDRFRRQFITGGESVEGKTCYEVTHESPERCKFCRKDELLCNTELKQISFEYYSARLDRSFLVYSNLIEWGAHGKALIEYSMDITESKHIKRQLDLLTTTDPLTKALNHSNLVSQLSRMLADAERKGQPLSIVYIKVKSLRQINRLYGFEAGDRLLAATARAIRECVRSGDVIGRYRNDVFVVLLQGCGKRVANARILKAKIQLGGMGVLPRPEDATFSFGIAENSQLIYSEDSAYMDDLLSIARRQMEAFQTQTRQVEEKEARSMANTALLLCGEQSGLMPGQAQAAGGDVAKRISHDDSGWRHQT